MALSKVEKQVLIIIEAQNETKKVILEVKKDMEKLIGVQEDTTSATASLTKGVFLGNIAFMAFRKVLDTTKEAFKVLASEMYGGVSAMEQADIALTTLTGSQETANALIEDAIDLAKKTPYEFGTVVAGTKKLIAMGVATENVIPSIEMLGDTVAATGGSNEVFDRMIWNLGQMQSQGRATTMDIRQMGMAGIPIMDALANSMEATTKEVSKMVEEGRVGYPEVMRALELLTGEGGRFEGMMEKQSGTMQGLTDNMKDMGRISITEFGEATGIFESFKDLLSEVMEFLNENSEAITEFITEIGYYFGWIGDDIDEFKASMIMDEVIVQIGTVAKWISALMSVFKGLVGYAKGLGQVLLMPFTQALEGIKAVGRALKSLMAFDLDGVENAFIEMNENMMGAWGEVGESFYQGTVDFSQFWETASQDVKSLWDGIKNKSREVTDSMKSDAKDWGDTMGDVASKTAKKMAKEMRKYAETVADKLKDYNDRLKDIIISHKEEVAEITASLKKEREERDKLLKDKTDDAKKESDLIKKKSDYAISVLKNNIANEKKINDVNSEKNIASLEEAIKAEEEGQQEKLSAVEDKLEEESNIIEEDFAEKISSLEVELKEEIALQKRYASDFATFKDSVKEDDITRLKRKFKEEMAELKRQHTIRMKELRTEGIREGNSYQAGFGAGAGGLANDMKKIAQSGAKQFIYQIKKDLNYYMRYPLISTATKTIMEKNLKLNSLVDPYGLFTPQYAEGTSYHPGGKALVGEHGAEIVDLPKGSKVYSNEESKEMLGGGISININAPVYGVDDLGDFLEEAFNKISSNQNLLGKFNFA